MHILSKVCLSLLLFCANMALAGNGKLLSTAGLTQIEGSSGGGIVPWATLAGYDSEDELGISVGTSSVNVQDFRLSTWGTAIGFHDRVELSFARHVFELRDAAAEIRQNVLGLKVRAYGDVIYSKWPQISLGMMHKHSLDSAIADAVGAEEANSGTDWYLTATKVHLGFASGYNLVWNATARATKANQIGLLGFGGPKDNSMSLNLEASVGVFFNRHIAAGFEYRQKPDNLDLKEEDWYDFFITYIPSKDVNFTAAWANLGKIAGSDSQDGLYVSITGYIW